MIADISIAYLGNVVIPPKFLDEVSEHYNRTSSGDRFELHLPEHRIIRGKPEIVRITYIHGFTTFTTYALMMHSILACSIVDGSIPGRSVRSQQRRLGRQGESTDRFFFNAFIDHYVCSRSLLI